MPLLYVPFFPFKVRASWPPHGSLPLLLQGQPCSVCRSSKGASLQCTFPSKPRCNTHFHIWCLYSVIRKYPTSHFALHLAYVSEREEYKMVAECNAHGDKASSWLWWPCGGCKRYRFLPMISANMATFVCTQNTCVLRCVEVK